MLFEIIQKKLFDWSKEYEIFTSSLTIFELISGIKDDDKNFKARQIAVKRLLESDIVIDWEFCQAKELSAFKIKAIDNDARIIQGLANNLVESKSYEEFKLKTVLIDNQLDDATVLQKFDNRIVALGKEISLQISNYTKNLPQNIKRDSRKRIDENLLIQVRLSSEMGMIPITEEAALSKNGTEQYYAVLKNYDNSLDVYLMYCAWMRFRVALYGDILAKND